MAAVYATAGLCLYLVARFVDVPIAWGPFSLRVGGLWTAVAVVLILGVPSLVAVVVGWFLGAKTPRLTTWLLQFWWLLTLCLGGVVGVVALMISTQIATGEGPSPAPETKVVLDEVGAIIGALVALAAGALGSSSRSWLAKRLIKSQYGPKPQFQEMPRAQPNIDAYYAITREDGSTDEGSFDGWSRKDAEVRLQAIHKALWPAAVARA